MLTFIEISRRRSNEHSPSRTFQVKQASELLMFTNIPQGFLSAFSEVDFRCFFLNLFCISIIHPKQNLIKMWKKH